MKKTFLILFLVTLLGFFCRFWRLSTNPVSLSMNEVAIAYNSFSILKTGRDEWGSFLPLSFRSVGDYKAPILIYFMVPAIAILGLNEFSTRFTVAIFGTLTIPVVFFLIKKITKNEKIAIFTAFSLAISPWHIQFSRATFEATLALFFVLAGTLVFFISLEKKNEKLWLSVVLFVLSLYTYHAERLFTPVFILGLLIIYRKDLFVNKKKLVTPFLVGMILLIPFAKIMLSSQGQTRARMTFITNDLDLRLQLQEIRPQNFFIFKFLDNNLIITLNFWVKRYLNYFDSDFLFFKGSFFTPPDAPDVGLLYLIELPFFILGLYCLFVERFLNQKARRLIIFWLLWGPVVASLTNNEQHALRALVWIPIPQLIVGLGAYKFFNKLNYFRKTIKVSIIVSLVVLTFVNIFYFFDIYIVHFPISFSECWAYGWKEAALFVWEHQKGYQSIVVDPAFGSQGPYTVGVPYLHFLFYGKYPPALFQNDPQRKKGWDSVNFANFVFRSIYWPDDRSKKNTLFIGSPWSLPPDDLDKQSILQVIKFKNGSTALIIVENK